MTSRTASERGKNNGISVFEARGSNLRVINGNVSFTVIIFFCLNIHRIFYHSGIFKKKGEGAISVNKSVLNPVYGHPKLITQSSVK